MNGMNGDYREWAPAPALADHVECLWTREPGPKPARVLPDACIDLIWTGTGVMVAGPDTGPVLATLAGHQPLVGLRFRPGAAAPVLGLPASELVDRRPDLAEIWSRAAGELAERLADAPDTTAVAATLQRAVIDRLTAPDPTLAGVVDGARSNREIRPLADDLGLSERQLRRRCHAAFGYGPKTLARILRFRRFIRLADAPAPFGLAELAIEAGYADQPHLTRECRRLSGLAPATLLAERRS